MPATYIDDRIVDAGTCPTEEDPITFDKFEVGDHIQRLRYKNGKLGNCYHDRTLEQYVASTYRSDAPFAEDMGSYKWSADLTVTGDNGRKIYSALARYYEGLRDESVNRLKGDRNLIGVYLPQDMTVIPEKCFFMCSRLKTVSLPKRLREIQKRAFRGCPLTHLILPKTLVSIGADALPESLRSVTYEGFEEGRNTLQLRPTDDATMQVATWIEGAVLANYFYSLLTLNDEKHTEQALHLVRQAAIDLELCSQDPFYAAVKTPMSVHDYEGYKDILIAMTTLQPSAYPAVLKFNSVDAADRGRTMARLAENIVSASNRRRRGYEKGLSALFQMAKAALEGGIIATVEIHDMTPLLIAAYGRQADLVELLLPYVDINQICGEGRETALQVSAFYGDLKSGKLLLEAGAAVEIEDRDGMTAEKIAREKGNTEVAEYLRRFKTVANTALPGNDLPEGFFQGGDDSDSEGEEMGLGGDSAYNSGNLLGGGADVDVVGVEDVEGGGAIFSSSA